MTAFARKVLTELPAPTIDRASNNFQILQNFTNTTNKAGGKVNLQINPRLTAFGRFGWRDVDIFDDPNIPLPSGGAGNAETYARNKQLALGTTYTPTSASLLEVRFGWSNTEGGKNPAALGTASALDAYGIPGLPSDPRVVGGLPTQLITGFSDLGSPGDQSTVAVPHRLQPEGELHVVGRPSLAQERLRVSAHPDRSAGCESALRSRRVRGAVQPARRGHGHQHPVQPCRLHVWRAGAATR